MQLRTRLPPALLALGLILALAVGAGAAARSIAPRPDLQTLFRTALRIVRHADHGTFARAVVLEADGLTRGGRCTSAGCTTGRPTHRARGVVSWRFVFWNRTPHSRFASAVITYGPPPRHFGRVTGHVQPVLEDVAIRHPPRMTLARAVSRLRQAGYRGAFVSATLRKPLGPKRSDPEYIFGLTNHRFVAVDTRTGRVRPLS